MHLSLNTAAMCKKKGVGILLQLQRSSKKDVNTKVFEIVSR